MQYNPPLCNVSYSSFFEQGESWNCLNSKVPMVVEHILASARVTAGFQAFSMVYVFVSDYGHGLRVTATGHGCWFLSFLRSPLFSTVLGSNYLASRAARRSATGLRLCLREVLS